MQNNIKLLYLFRALRTFLVVAPVVVPFLQSNNLTQSQVYYLQSFWAVTVIIFEVPSGYFADFLGRKNSMLIGAIISTGAFIVYAFSYSFWPMVFGEILWGIGYSFISGADSALAYESFASIEDQEKNISTDDSCKKFEGRSHAYSAVSEAIASVLGGFIAVVSLRSTMYVQVVVYVILIFTIIPLKEPPRIKRKDKNPFKEIINISKDVLFKDVQLKSVIYYGAVLGTLTQTVTWIIQPYYKLVGIPIGWFGCLWAIQLGSMALFSGYSHSYETKFGRKRALSFLLVVGLVSYLALGLFPSKFSLIFILGFFFVRGTQIPIITNQVNELTDSDVRATVLSVRNLVQKALYAILGPIVGLVVDATSLTIAILFSAIIYAILGLFTLRELDI